MAAGGGGRLPPEAGGRAAPGSSRRVEPALSYAPKPLPPHEAGRVDPESPAESQSEPKLQHRNGTAAGDDIPNFAEQTHAAATWARTCR